jgi:hypothetical protein
MTISQRQFYLLTEMGISLWQRKVLNATRVDIEPNNHSKSENSENSPKETHNINAKLPPKKACAINLIELQQQPLFIDIIKSLSLSQEQISQTVQGLQLASFSWEFCQQNKITTNKQKLTTPPLQDIAQSSQLKRQLWQALQELK